MSTITGTEGNDFLFGTSGDDTVQGLGGNDTLSGVEGNDTLEGGAGFDTLTGGSGTDLLTGGADLDIFRDTAAGLNGDRITDFSMGESIQITDLTIQNAQLGISGSTLTYNGGSVTIDGLGPGRLVMRPITGGGIDIRLQHNAHNDFNGDGLSDVLWRNDSGLVTDWLGVGNGLFVGNGALVTQVPNDWHVAGTGDFDGDGRVDVLWRNDAGIVTNWLGQPNGAFAGNSNLVTQVPNDWRVIGTGDFNGDGRADVLWRNDNGLVTDWLGQPSGTFTGNSNLLSQLATSWHFAGTGDFNGDGLDDVLWRSDDGTVIDWLGKADGTFTVNSQNLHTQVDTSWHIAGTGDFNGDGRADVLWRNDSGAILDWLGQADGTFVGNNQSFTTAFDSSWHVVGTGDFNGDAIDDILWRNDGGTVTDWFGQANGSFVSNQQNLHTQVPTDWHVLPQELFF